MPWSDGSWVRSKSIAKPVERLSRDLCALDVKSRGLRAFREYLTEYVASVSFRNLATEAGKLKSDLSAHQILPAY